MTLLSCRKRREIEEEHKRNEKERKELELFVMKQRKKAMRSMHFKQLETLEFLPASKSTLSQGAVSLMLVGAKLGPKPVECTEKGAPKFKRNGTQTCDNTVQK